MIIGALALDRWAVTLEGTAGEHPVLSPAAVPSVTPPIKDQCTNFIFQLYDTNV